MFKKMLVALAITILVSGTFVVPATADAEGASGATTWWRPTAERPLALHWVLDGPLNITNAKQMGLRDFNSNVLPEPDVYDIDGEYNTRATVNYLQNKGKKVICYFDAGVYEDYRSDAYRFQQLSPQIWGAADEPWDGSYWLDIRRVSELEPIMKDRMQMCKDKGFDAIEPDEIDGWENANGFANTPYTNAEGVTHYGITHQDQLIYNKALAQWAHELGMSIGQKGDIIQTRDLVDHFDWTLNEECFQYNECTNPYDPNLRRTVLGLQLYTQANKAVFVAEYKAYTATKWSQICTTSKNNKFNTTRFKLGLPNNGGRMPCSTAKVW